MPTTPEKASACLRSGRAMIERGFARPLRKQALAFSGVVGTPLYEGLASGELTYERFVLHKAA